MLMSKAYAQEITAETAALAAEAPSAAGAFAWNMGLILILVVMFYILLIRPQQKRFTEHKSMLDALKKGDKIVTSGGLVGKIDKIPNEEEMIVDLGGDTKVTMMRSSIQRKMDKPEAKTETKAKPETKKAAAKKADKKADKKK